MKSNRQMTSTWTAQRRYGGLNLFHSQPKESQLLFCLNSLITLKKYGKCLWLNKCTVFNIVRTLFVVECKRGICYS